MSRFVIAIAGALFVQSSALANLEISDVKARYSPNGPERKSLEVVPGDAIHFSFRMNGLALDGDRKTDAAVEMEISDSSGKLLAQQKSPSLRIQPFLGKSLDGSAFINVPAQFPPGNYKLKVTVVDQISK